MPISLPWPDQTESHRLTAGLLAGLPTTSAEIAAAFLVPLTAYLCRAFPHTDPDLCATAAGDAILATVKHPERYNHEQLELGAYLRMAARRDLLNLLAKERRQQRAIPLDSVAEPAERGNSSRESEDTPSWDDPRLVAVIASFDLTEHAALDVMRHGERGTIAFVQAVGLPDVPPEELTATVKRIKDRLKQRLIRAVRGDT